MTISPPLLSPLPTSRAKIILDSVAPCGMRLTTIEAEYPRYIHADLLTHRILSRNGLSSRAEPVANVIQRASDDPVEPLVWMYDAKRMQHGHIMSPDDAERCRTLWNASRDNALTCAREFLRIGLHRQYLNRIIEPYIRIKMVISATSWANFLALRCHPSPMPEIQQLAVTIARLLKASTPTPVADGGWHLPYVAEWERTATAYAYDVDTMAKVSTARGARASYGNLGDSSKPPSIDADLALYERLMVEDPKHASPAEHPAMATGDRNVRSGNFQGWIQFRHTIAGESATEATFDLDARLVQYEGVDYIV